MDRMPLHILLETGALREHPRLFMRGKGIIMHRSTPRGDASLRFGQVRTTFWLLLAGAVLLALAVPGLTLWRSASSPLGAAARLWPATPRAHTPTYVLVTVTDPADRTAVQGPWAQVVVLADMPAMAMGMLPRVVHGPSDSAHPVTTFAIPLRLDMVGPWRIHVALQTPGRPTWRSELQVTVLPPQPAAAAPPSAAAPPGGAAPPLVAVLRLQAGTAPCAVS